MNETLTKTIEVTDYYEFAAVQEGWDASYRPLQINTFAARLEVCRTRGIQVDLDTYDCALEITATTPKDAITIALPGGVDGSYISKGIEVSTDRIDVYGAEREVHAVTKPDSSLITCCLYKVLVDHLTDSPIRSTLVDHRFHDNVIYADRRTLDEARLWCTTYLALCRTNEISAEAHARLIDEILLIVHAALSAAREDCSNHQRSRYQVARRARDYMIDRQSEPPTITEICNFLKISARTLNYAFQDTYNVSPKRFLKARRLSAAHDALKHAAPRTRVTDIALALGFWDFGHFAKDYRTMFGETPSATLRG